jgi:phage host-nuclease inhibitor protein Gam
VRTKRPISTWEEFGELQNAPLYIQVDQAMFAAAISDEFTVQAANNKEEIKQLLSVGFEYVCQKDDLLFFRKRK